jgi:hypothetical protein
MDRAMTGIRASWAAALLATGAFTSGCASKHETMAANAAAPAGWRSVVTDADAVRLSQWRDAWMKALAAARTAGASDRIAAEGPLLQPDVALPLQAPPPPGAYRCRTIKIGAKSEGLLNYVDYPWFDCHITDDRGLLRFSKLNGSQRPTGIVLPQTDKRMVFLGTLQLGDETNVLAYGRDRERDMAGLLERIGDRRWRLVLPYPHFESLIDVMELVPGSRAAR